MTGIKTIMETAKNDTALLTQSDHDEIEKMSENIMKFLDEHDNIDRESFMMGFTIANMNAMIEIMKDCENESSLVLLPEAPVQEEEKVIYPSNCFKLRKILLSKDNIEVYLSAPSRFSDILIAQSLEKVIEENEIEHGDIKPLKSKYSFILKEYIRNLIEQKMDDIGMKIFIYGFSIFKDERTVPVKE